MRSIEWDAGDIIILDQTQLPHRQEFRRLHSPGELAEAISSLQVRGAPALGIAGAFGVAQAAVLCPSTERADVLEAAERSGAILAATRPTAVNLAWGIERVLVKARTSRIRDGEALADVMVQEAIAIQAEDEEACTAMAKHALEFFEPHSVVLTHCNTGILCTGGRGTALGAIRYAHEAGLQIAVVATETRPLLQGSRLTAWELQRFNVPMALVVDAAAPGLIQRGDISLVVVGADRIAANGDVANKVGTYPLALAATAARIPFVVVAPTTTVDLATRAGDAIPVEERDPDEVRTIMGSRDFAPDGIEAINPAFDVTPADLITAIVTERGVARPPFRRSLVRITAVEGAARTASSPKARPEKQPTGAKAKPATTTKKRQPARTKEPAKAKRATRSASKARMTPKPRPTPKARTSTLGSSARSRRARGSR